MDPGGHRLGDTMTQTTPPPPPVSIPPVYLQTTTTTTEPTTGKTLDCTAWHAIEPPQGQPLEYWKERYGR